jgi:hypothetical protein
METLNAIEKTTLLVSTGIVWLANLFVMIDRIKNNATEPFKVDIKLRTIKNAFFAFVLIGTLSSCSGGKFLSRKYTSGTYIQQVKSLKYNTVFADTNKAYSSADKEFKVVMSSQSSSQLIHTNIVDGLAGSVLKKDSIFIISRKGRNRKVVVKNNLPTVITHVDKKGNRIKTKVLSPLQADKVRANYETKIKVFSILALCLSLVPILGFIFARTARRLIRQNRETNSFKHINRYNAMSDIALGLSIIPSLMGVLLAAFIVFALVMFAFGGAASSIFIF